MWRKRLRRRCEVCGHPAAPGAQWVSGRKVRLCGVCIGRGIRGELGALQRFEWPLDDETAPSRS